MAQNISLLGASYSDVPGVTLPKTGGGTALFSDPSITTAIASDVAQGKQFLLADGSIGTGTASGGGGGGASNIVTGTFKGTTTGAAMTVTIPYTGTGWPIAFLIFPTGGIYNSSSPFYSLVQRYAYASTYGVKNASNTSPTYDSTANENNMSISSIYKSSASSATTYSSNQSIGANVLRNTDASSGQYTALRFKNNKTLSVFIASNSYGFAANIEYTYYVIYSS